MSNVNWGRRTAVKTLPVVLVMSNYGDGYSAHLPIKSKTELEEVKRRLKGLYTFRSPNR